MKWNGRSGMRRKRLSSRDLCSGRIEEAAMKLRWMSLCAVVLFALPVCGMQAQETKAAERPAAAARSCIYRLTYTLTEMEGDRRIGLQHAVLNSGPGPGSIKIGSRVP